MTLLSTISAAFLIIIFFLTLNLGIRYEERKLHHKRKALVNKAGIGVQSIERTVRHAKLKKACEVKSQIFYRVSASSIIGAALVVGYSLEWL